jgi:hypothetical protein
MPTSAQEFAEDYGYQLAFLRSDPELYRIFTTAMSKKWDATRFVAAVKASGWYKRHGEAYRQNMALRTTDPGTWRQKLGSQLADVGAMARGMGVTLDTRGLNKIAEDSVMFGWSEQQIRNVLSRHIKPGAASGEAGEIRYKLRETAYRNGFTMPASSLDHWAKAITSGADTLEAVQQRIRLIYGAKLAPGFEKELQAGMDLYDLAQPYMQTMAQTLELNPADIDLFDPTIRAALGSSTDKDGKPGSRPLWDFEVGLRHDKRFMKTKQAQDQVMAVGNKVLQDFGLVS